MVNPNEIVREYGADALRLYEMFMGPLEATKPWATNGVGGVKNFLDRVWRLIVDEKSDTDALSPALVDADCDDDQNRMLHATIKKVTEDTDHMSFNTAIARMMEFTNFFTRSETRPIVAMKTFLVLLAPYAPHLCEELWHRLGETESISKAAWPTHDESALVESVIEVPLQINGKLRSKMMIAVDADKDTMLAQAKSDPTIAEQIAGKTIVKEIVVPGRLVNLVVK